MAFAMQIENAATADESIADARAAFPRERFAGVERLYGLGSLDRLMQAHVCVIGIGGVGSWAAEALARSGVGRLTLIDADEICVSNTNRQLRVLGTPRKMVGLGGFGLEVTEYV